MMAGRAFELGRELLNAAVKPPEINTLSSAAGAGATENATATRVMAASAMDLNILIGYCDLDRPALAQSPATFSAPPTACTVRRLRRV